MKDIRFAGISFSWTREYAKSYSDKLYEMGMPAKPLEYEGAFIVAYSCGSFTLTDAITALNELKNDKGTNETKEE